MDPVEKLLYCYLITSPASNMEGLYKTTLRRIAFETGIDQDMVRQMCARLEERGLAGFNDGWVCVTQAIKHMPDSPKMLTHAKKVYAEATEPILKWAVSIGYLLPDRVPIPYPTKLDNTTQDETGDDTVLSNLRASVGLARDGRAANAGEDDLKLGGESCRQV